MRETGGRGTGRINDTSLHTGLDIDQIVILEDDTSFETVLMATKDTTDLEWELPVNIAESGDEPDIGLSHVKGEYIPLKFNEEKITAIQLSSGSIRYYNRI